MICSNTDAIIATAWGLVLNRESDLAESQLVTAANQATEQGPVMAALLRRAMALSSDPAVRKFAANATPANDVDAGSAIAVLRRDLQNAYSPNRADAAAGLVLASTPGMKPPSIIELRRDDVDALTIHMVIGATRFDPKGQGLGVRTLMRANGTLTRLGRKLARRFPGLHEFLKAKFRSQPQVGTWMRIRSLLPGRQRNGDPGRGLAVAGLRRYVANSSPVSNDSIDKFGAAIASPKFAKALAGAVVVVTPGPREAELEAVLSQHESQFKLVRAAAFRALIGYVNPRSAEGVTKALAQRILFELDINAADRPVYLVSLELSEDLTLESIRVVDVSDHTLLLSTQRVPASLATRDAITTQTRMLHACEVLVMSGEGFADQASFLMDIVVGAAASEAERASAMWKIAGLLWEMDQKERALMTFRMGLAMASPSEVITGFLPDELVNELKKIKKRRSSQMIPSKQLVTAGPLEISRNGN